MYLFNACLPPLLPSSLLPSSRRGEPLYRRDIGVRQEERDSERRVIRCRREARGECMRDMSELRHESEKAGEERRATSSALSGRQVNGHLPLPPSISVQVNRTVGRTVKARRFIQPYIRNHVSRGRNNNSLPVNAPYNWTGWSPASPYRSGQRSVRPGDQCLSTTLWVRRSTTTWHHIR